MFVPRGTPHTFRKKRDAAGCIVGTFTPPQFADYFRELAGVIAHDGTAPDHDAWIELYARYDTSFAPAT